MVFKSFTHLARPSFTKALNHGYAQSVVAATQSSYASSTTQYTRSSKVGRPQTSQLHTNHANTSASPNTPIKTGLGATERDGDPNLRKYYEALWKRQQSGEEPKEWAQFQFAKRIEWSPPSIAPCGRDKEYQDAAFGEDASRDCGGLDRAYSASAIDDIKKAEDEDAEATAVAKVDEAIAQVITEIQGPEPLGDSDMQAEVSNRGGNNAQQSSINLGNLSTPLSSMSPEDTASPTSNATIATSIEDTDPQILSGHIARLYKQRFYSQIPPLFESLVVRGLKPTIRDYNALLASAINLPIAKHQVVPKALDIFSDMLRREVQPDTSIYNTLIVVLANRALDVMCRKNSLDERRARFSGSNNGDTFLFSSDEAEYEILLQDDSLSMAVHLFRTSTVLSEARRYSAEMYRVLVTACALQGRLDDMITAYTHMEAQEVTPIASMFPPMIKAFARIGDLSSAVECYNGYKALAVADDAGQLAVIDRNDNEVYVAVVRAYATCGRHHGGMRFLEKIVDSFAKVTENRQEKLEAAQDSIVLNAQIEDRLTALDFAGALQIATESSLTPAARTQAMRRICISAADNNNPEMSSEAIHHLSSDGALPSTVTLSMLALHIRQGNIDGAREVWTSLRTFDRDHIHSTASYVIALLDNGDIDEGLTQAREAFASICANATTRNLSFDVSEQIDEAIGAIGTHIAKNAIVPSPGASISFLWAMVENGGLLTPWAEQILAGLGPMQISCLEWQDIVLLLQVQAGLIAKSEITHDVAHSERFAHLLEITLSGGAHLDDRTASLVEKALEQLSSRRPDLVNKWHGSKYASTNNSYGQQLYSSQTASIDAAAAPTAESYDPYDAATDYKGSAIIAEELDNRRNNVGLSEALVKFRNVRRAGRHPRYIAYAKLISAAAREGRTSLIRDIHGTAQTDIPLLPQYPIVCHGWSMILDSLVGAYLVAGERPMAARFHQEMLNMGTAPSANTFGLYITTLKDTAKTFDEASEAVAIFGRAVAEGVTPSSFLYNALIGKLGKARRIDDCLRYFQEMRVAGIHPTSVTYGTVVNALCRVSDDRFAEELFDEMESMPNYKPRPAPYNSLMQFFLTTKRDSQKVLSYYERMRSKGIQPTMHTYKLLIDTHATLEPVNLAAAEGVLDTIRESGQRPEAVHYASLIHAKGCALHDMQGSREIFDQVLARKEVNPQACLYQALFESMAANHCVAQTDEVLAQMFTAGIDMTPYIANTLIRGWAMEKNIEKSKVMYDRVGIDKREPSTYEAMTRAFLTAQDREGALSTVREMLSRGYPTAVSSKILELVGHGAN